MPWTLVIALIAGPALAGDVDLEPGDDVGALTAALLAGDTITFNDGVYDLESGVTWTGVGTEEEPIRLVATRGAEPVLRAASGGNVARITDSEWVIVEGLTFEVTDAHYDANRPNGLTVNNSSQIMVRDNEIRHVGGTAVYLQGNNSGITLEHNQIHDTRDGSGIYVGCWDASCWTRDSVITNNWIHDLGGDGSRGIIVEHGGQGLEISHNVIYQIGHRGIRTASTEFGAPNLIEGNVVWSAVHDGIYVYGSAVVQNNIIFGIDGGGIAAEDNDRGTFQDVVISHNTVIDTTDWGIWLDDWVGYDGLVFTNNAVANPVGLAFEANEDDLDESVFISNNVLSGLVVGLDDDAGHFIPGGGYSDFSDVEQWDFYPSDTSLTINAANPDAAAWVPQQDFNLLPRDGLAPDAGAYEYGASGNPGWVIREGFKDLTADADSGIDVGGGCCANNGDQAGAVLFPLLLLGWSRRRR